MTYAEMIATRAERAAAARWYEERRHHGRSGRRSVITWGTYGKGDDKRATVFCMDCRKVLKEGVSIPLARSEADKAAAKHVCDVPTNGR